MSEDPEGPDKGPSHAACRDNGEAAARDGRRRSPRPLELLRPMLLAGLVTAMSIANVSAQDNVGYDPRKVSVDDLDVVDCILPGQVRMLGRMTYQTPRRQVRSTRIDCSVRGGESKLYDRSDSKSALEAWLPEAEKGGLEAQNRVAMIFEGMFGGEANYVRAADWYRRAAEGGHKPSQYSLGVMLEQGRGVEKNVLEALEWYRKASGIEGDRLRLSSETEKELAVLRDELNAALSDSQAQIELLEGQVASLRTDASSQSANAAKAKSQVATLNKLVEQLKKDQEGKKTQLASIPQFRTPTPISSPSLTGAELPLPASAAPSQRIATLGDIAIGKYYALVIGNQDYQHLDALQSPKKDAEMVADVLERKYGFTVMLLLDADAVSIKRAINELDTRAGENDNVLIYYAGHGVIRDSAVSAADPRANDAEKPIQGFWLPVEAERERDTFWIDNMWVTEHLSLNKARRVLVVADSCYAGLFSSDPSVLLGGNTDYSEAEIKELVPLRARYVLSSGDVKPVLDQGVGGHSIFAQAFLDVLSGNKGVLSSVALYQELFTEVAAQARKLGIEQLPQLRPIRPAGHEWGDFFFVPRSDALAGRAQ